MKIEIEIDENYITELVSQEIAKRIVAERGYENREAKIGIRDGVDKAIKQYIYKEKLAEYRAGINQPKTNWGWACFFCGLLNPTRHEVCERCGTGKSE